MLQISPEAGEKLLAEMTALVRGEPKAGPTTMGAKRPRVEESNDHDENEPAGKRRRLN